MMIIILALNINDGLGISKCDSVNILFFFVSDTIQRSMGGNQGLWLHPG